MRVLRSIFAILLLISAPAGAAQEPDDWQFMGGALALVQQFLHLAAHSPDPQAGQKAIDGMLSGKNPEANRVASGIVGEALLEVPPEYRAALLGIGRDLLVLAQRENARQRTGFDASRADEAIQARKDLHGMGLTYHDAQQYAEALKRGDEIAADLFRRARGLRTMPAGS